MKPQLLEHIKHIPGDSALCGLHTCNISIVLIVFKTAVQTKSSTLDRASIFQNELRKAILRLQGLWTKKFKKDLQLTFQKNLETKNNYQVYVKSEKCSANSIRSTIWKSQSH